MRAVLGDEQLHYLGFSYGTFLGATYAGLYPENVGRLVLDGALDPSLTNDELSLQQAAGFEQALRSYVTDCMAGSGLPADRLGRRRHAADRRPGGPRRGPADRRRRRLRRQRDARLLRHHRHALQRRLLAAAHRRRWPRRCSQNTASQLLEYANIYLDRTPDGHVHDATRTWRSRRSTASTTRPRPATTSQMVAFRDQVAAGRADVRRLVRHVARLRGLAVPVDPRARPRSTPPARRRSSSSAPPATRPRRTSGRRASPTSSTPARCSPGRARATPPTAAPGRASPTPSRATCWTARCRPRARPATERRAPRGARAGRVCRSRFGRRAAAGTVGRARRPAGRRRRLSSVGRASHS